MKKLFLMGRSEAGKTTLTQALEGKELHYHKTQYTNTGDDIIDSPGEYSETKRCGMGLACFSFEADVLALLMERDFQGLFDGGVASCEVHVNKPDPRIYQALLDKYGLKASESVFIDDRQDNVQAAFELGFVGIRMKDSVGTLVRSLATCNVVVR